MLLRCLRADEDSESEGEDVEDAMDADLAALNGEDNERDDERDDRREDGREEQVQAIEGKEVEREEEHEKAEADIPDEFRRIIWYLHTFERPQNLT